MAHQRILAPIDEADIQGDDLSGLSKLKQDNPNAFLFGIYVKTQVSGSKPGDEHRWFSGGHTWESIKAKIAEDNAEQFIVLAVCETKAEAHALADEKNGEKI